MTDRKYDVIHIGESNHDIKVPDVPDAFLTDQSETGTYMCGPISDGCGGDALNQAICLSNLGDHSAYFGRLQNGYPGTRIRELLLEQGVDTSLITMADDCRSTDIIVNVMKGGAHRFLLGKRANWSPRPEEFSYEVVASAKVLAIGSLFAIDHLDDGGLQEMLGICRREGVTVVADMTHDIASKGPRIYDEVYRLMDYVVPSLEEASFVSGETDEKRIADFFLEKGAGNVIIKMGHRGSYFKNRETSFHTKAYQIDPVDTTGCGDNFTAGFIHCLLKDLPVEECVRFASAAGSLNALGLGASSYIRSEQMVLDFMASTPLRD